MTFWKSEPEMVEHARRPRRLRPERQSWPIACSVLKRKCGRICAFSACSRASRELRLEPRQLRARAARSPRQYRTPRVSPTAAA